MKKNVGIGDKVFRILIAIGIIATFVFGYLLGMLAYVLLIFAALFVLTGLIGFCPLYSLLGISTCKSKSK